MAGSKIIFSLSSEGDVATGCVTCDQDGITTWQLLQHTMQ